MASGSMILFLGDDPISPVIRIPIEELRRAYSPDWDAGLASVADTGLTWRTLPLSYLFFSGRTVTYLDSAFTTLVTFTDLAELDD